MAIELRKLPYAKDALEPYISRMTIDFHYEKHHRKYVEKLNELIKGTPHEMQSLEEILMSSDKTNMNIFNNAAQVWNHNFFWSSLKPDGSLISKSLKNVIEKDFDSFQNFKTLFSEQALGLFGSGWVWLVKDKNGKIKICATKDAGNPLTEGNQPMLTCDIWEHAYYLDYQNERKKFIESFWQIVNWEFVEENLGLYEEGSKGMPSISDQHRPLSEDMQAE